MSNIELLKKIPAFKEFNYDQLNSLNSCCVDFTYNIGEKLFAEGDEALNLWFIIDGQVELRFNMPDGRPTTNDLTISSLKTNGSNLKSKILGWSCFIPPYKMILSAFCVSRYCDVIKCDKKNLLKIFQTDSDMGYKFMSYLVMVIGYRANQFFNEIAKKKGKYLISGW